MVGAGEGGGDGGEICFCFRNRHLVLSFLQQKYMY